MKGTYTEIYESGIPKLQNGFCTMLMDIRDKEVMLEACKKEREKFMTYLMSYEIIQETENYFKIELEFSCHQSPMISAFNLGIMYADIIKQRKLDE